MACQAGAYPGFRSMKRLGVFLLPPGWDASPPPSIVRRYPFIHLGGERHCESKVSCPRTQHNVLGQGSNPDHSIRSRAHQPWGHRGHPWISTPWNLRPSYQPKFKISAAPRSNKRPLPSPALFCGRVIRQQKMFVFVVFNLSLPSLFLYSHY